MGRAPLRAENSARRPTARDLALDRDGHCAGSMRPGGDGGGVELVERGDEVWMKPDLASGQAQLPGDRGEAAAHLFEARTARLDRRRAARGPGRDLRSGRRPGRRHGRRRGRGERRAPDRPEQGKLTQVDGLDVGPLTGSRDGVRSAACVTADAPHRLITAEQHGGDSDVTIVLDDHDEPVPSATPRRRSRSTWTSSGNVRRAPERSGRKPRLPPPTPDAATTAATGAAATTAATGGGRARATAPLSSRPPPSLRRRAPDRTVPYAHRAPLGQKDSRAVSRGSRTLPGLAEAGPLERIA